MLQAKMQHARTHTHKTKKGVNLLGRPSWTLHCSNSSQTLLSLIPPTDSLKEDLSTSQNADQNLDPSPASRLKCQLGWISEFQQWIQRLQPFAQRTQQLRWSFCICSTELKQQSTHQVQEMKRKFPITMNKASSLSVSATLSK